MGIGRWTGRWGIAAIVVGALAVAPSGRAFAQEVGSTCLPAAPATAEATLPPETIHVYDSAGDRMEVARVTTGDEPSGIAVDANDTWGRVFVADRGSDQVSVVYGRSPDLRIGCRLRVGEAPYGVAVDDATGLVLVTLQGEPRVAAIDGRRDEQRVVGSVDLPADPGWVVVDQATRRAFVSLPAAGRVAVLEPAEDGSYRLASTFEAGRFPFFLGFDPASGRLLVSDRGQALDAESDEGRGAVLVFDGRADTPTQVGDPIPASVPTGVEIDPLSGVAWVLENGADRLMTIRFPGTGRPVVSRVPIDRFVDEGENLNPVDLVFLPATRELVVTLAALVRTAVAGHLDVFRVDESGTPTWDRFIPSAQRTRGIGLDPVTGRVFVSEVTDDRLAAFRLDQPSRPAPPPASIAESLPGPLSVSLAPEDVVRSVGMSLLVLLLVGAPTPLFNETLETNLETIQGWVGRRLPGAGRLGRFGRASLLSRVAAGARRFSASLGGLGLYVLAGALIYSFLTPGFPGENGLLVFGVAILGLALATAADIVPGERYVERRYGDRGRVRVALWTLALAAICVLISRLAGMQPGYMYGIIGAFTFTVALGVADEGRMEARGAFALLLLGLAAWFARIPFEPTPGVPASGASLIVNSGLVGIFVVAVEGLVFGLVPLRFLPGSKIFAWSRWRWLLLWGAGLALFAHVLVYPVTVAQPNPDPASLTTTLWSVGIYGGIAVGFWALFRWRAGRLPQEGGSTSAVAQAAAGSGGVGEITGASGGAGPGEAAGSAAVATTKRDVGPVPGPDRASRGGGD